MVIGEDAAEPRVCLGHSDTRRRLKRRCSEAGGSCAYVAGLAPGARSPALRRSSARLLCQGPRKASGPSCRALGLQKGSETTASGQVCRLVSIPKHNAAVLSESLSRHARVALFFGPSPSPPPPPSLEAEALTTGARFLHVPPAERPACSVVRPARGLIRRQFHELSTWRPGHAHRVREKPRSCPAERLHDGKRACTHTNVGNTDTRMTRESNKGFAQSEDATSLSRAVTRLVSSLKVATAREATAFPEITGTAGA